MPRSNPGTVPERPLTNSARLPPDRPLTPSAPRTIGPRKLLWDGGKLAA